MSTDEARLERARKYMFTHIPSGHLVVPRIEAVKYLPRFLSDFAAQEVADAVREERRRIAFEFEDKFDRYISGHDACMADDCPDYVRVIECIDKLRSKGEKE